MLNGEYKVISNDELDRLIVEAHQMRSEHIGALVSSSLHTFAKAFRHVFGRAQTT